MLITMKKTSSQILVDLLRLYFDALLEARGEGALAEFGRRYQVPDYTISRIRSGVIKAPRADIFLNILNGMQDIPFRELKKHLPNYFDSVNLDKISKIEVGTGMSQEFMELLIKFTDILSGQTLLDTGLVTGLFSMVNSLHNQLQDKQDQPPPQPQSIKK